MEATTGVKTVDKQFEFDAKSQLPHERKVFDRNYVAIISVETTKPADAKMAVKELRALLHGADLNHLFSTTKSYEVPHPTNVARYISEEIAGVNGTEVCHVRVTVNSQTVQYTKKGHT